MPPRETWTGGGGSCFRNRFRFISGPPLAFVPNFRQAAKGRRIRFAVALAYPCSVVASFFGASNVSANCPCCRAMEYEHGGTCVSACAGGRRRGGRAAGIRRSNFFGKHALNGRTPGKLLEVEGALLGAVLGIASWALRSSVGAGVWHLFHAFGFTPRWELSPKQWFHDGEDYGNTARVYALYIVWQTGMATAVGVLFRQAGIKNSGPANTQ